ncbi:MAG: putative metal-dependent hydrolase [Bacteroidetes bacterium]|nr:MAG: putative metal-dependent hydrolase [Bacteroidota bacterium]
MQTLSLDQLRYPVGKFTFNKDADDKEINQWISEIENLPAHLKNALKDLSDPQINTSYREGGWTVRQVVHHLADSHINAYIRIKLALTENNPTIKPYEEKLWAELDDAKNIPVEISFSLLDALHARWVYMLKKLSAEDLSKTVFHPESKREMSVRFLIALYVWHGKHHVAHITSLRKMRGW